MQQFDFSQDALKKRQRFLWIVVLASEPVVFAVVLLTTDLKTGILLPAFAVAAALTLGLVAVQMRSINKSLRAMKVVVEDVGIVKRHAGGEQNLAWDDIVGVDITESPQGDSIYVKVRGKDKNTIHLSGFEKMHEIADLIRRNVPDHVIVETRRSKTDAESPIYYILGGVTALAAITVGRVRGAHVDDIFEFAISAAAALYLLMYRPMTKYNAGWKRLEILFILFMICIVIRMLFRMLTLNG